MADADIVVLAIPLHRFLDIDPALLDGKLVVDAMNYWPASDGVLTAFEDGGSSEIVARRLAGSAVVKALNHIGYHELEGRTRPAGAPDRRAAGVAGDDPAAVAAIAGLVDRIGYDPVRLESLRAGRVLQPGGPVFGVTLTRPEFEQAVHEEALYVGSPETVAQKIATNLRALDATRFDLKYGMPGPTHDQLMTNIELYAARSSRASANCSAKSFFLDETKQARSREGRPAVSRSARRRRKTGS